MSGEGHDNLRRVNLRKLGERGLLDDIRRRFGGLAPASPAGIGDDAALLGTARNAWLVSTDCLIEHRHFRRDEPGWLLGRKSLAVNLSDIAAMGGRPDSFLLTLGIPDGLSSRFLDEFLGGLLSMAKENSVKLVGGDTSGSPGPLVISITILGRPGTRRPARLLARSGARPGDGIYVSGPLGGSAAGRAILDRGWRLRMDRARRRVVAVSSPPSARLAGADRRRVCTRAAEAVRSHLDPVPRLELGRRLLERKIASSAMDLSDGVSTDLRRLAEASDVGARLLAPAIPIADSARALAPFVDAEPLGLALHGGEDYELLFTVPPSSESRLIDLDVTFIGRVTPRRGGLSLVDGSGGGSRLEPLGHDHFAAR